MLQLQAQIKQATGDVTLTMLGIYLCLRMYDEVGVYGSDNVCLTRNAGQK
jgi:hypothetical protein